MRKFIVLFCCAAAVHLLHAQSSKDTADIRATVLNYAEGWYEGNAARMEQAIHPQLAKRIVGWSSERGNHRNVMQDMTAEKLIDNTRKRFGTNVLAEEQIKNIVILDIYNNTASVKAEMRDWIDYMHMARWNGKWKIINVLWEMKPQQ